MEEELILYVSEKDLEQFPESDIDGNSTVRKEQIQNSTAVEKKEESQTRNKKTTSREEPPKIPSLLDIKIPEVYAAWRNGRRRSGNQRTAQKKENWTRTRSRWGK